MRWNEVWNERIGEKLFVCGREWEGKWELEKLKVRKLERRKWENIKEIGTLENIRKIGNMGNVKDM